MEVNRKSFIFIAFHFKTWITQLVVIEREGTTVLSPPLQAEVVLVVNDLMWLKAIKQSARKEEESRHYDFTQKTK